MCHVVFLGLPHVDVSVMCCVLLVQSDQRHVFTLLEKLAEFQARINPREAAKLYEQLIKDGAAGRNIQTKDHTTTLLCMRPMSECT